MRQIVVRALAGLDPISVENPAHPGTPDVNYTGGWIELKCVDAWPAREATPLRVPHFTAEQRAWLLRRCATRRQGAHLLLRVGERTESEWLLFAGDTAARFVGSVPRADLRSLAVGLWTPTLVASQLRALLSP